MTKDHICRKKPGALAVANLSRAATGPYKTAGDAHSDCHTGRIRSPRLVKRCIPELLCFLLVPCLAQPLKADSISTSATATMAIGLPCSSSGAGEAMCIGNDADGGAISSSAFASYSSGTLSFSTDIASGVTSTVIDSGEIDDSSDAQADFAYNFAILNGPASGTLLLFGEVQGSSMLTINGCTSCGPDSYADALIVLLNGTEKFVGPNAGSSDFVAASGIVTDFEVTIPFSNSLASGAGWELAGPSLCYLFPSEGASCSAASSYSSAILGAEVLDSSGNVVSGATVLSDSGFNPNAAPEPGTFGLLGIALISAPLLKRRLRLRQQ